MNTTQNNYILRTINNLQNQIDLMHIHKKNNLGKFNILYLNINSLLNKLDDLELEIYNIRKKNKNKTIHAIALTEIRLQERVTPFFNLPHYTSFYRMRPDGHGGCALFVHDTLSCNVIAKTTTNNIELLTVNITELAASITVVYKQPSVNDDTFINTLNSYIERKRNMVIIGDTNLNL